MFTGVRNRDGARARTFCTKWSAAKTADILVSEVSHELRNFFCTGNNIFFNISEHETLL